MLMMVCAVAVLWNRSASVDILLRTFFKLYIMAMIGRYHTSGSSGNAKPAWSLHEFGLLAPSAKPADQQMTLVLCIID